MKILIDASKLDDEQIIKITLCQRKYHHRQSPESQIFQKGQGREVCQRLGRYPPETHIYDIRGK